VELSDPTLHPEMGKYEDKDFDLKKMTFYLKEKERKGHFKVPYSIRFLFSISFSTFSLF